ncbi:hypothetical protein BOX30_10520, partial [Leptospirillum ferriphilum]
MTDRPFWKNFFACRTDRKPVPGNEPPFKNNTEKQKKYKSSIFSFFFCSFYFILRELFDCAIRVSLE